uniref:Uncharacterized protein n=1 Tax=viral metagenome TaxID=1070528 RepID=A0A2V0RJC4_9ZZZZ
MYENQAVIAGIAEPHAAQTNNPRSRLFSNLIICDCQLIAIGSKHAGYELAGCPNNIFPTDMFDGIHQQGDASHCLVLHTMRDISMSRHSLSPGATSDFLRYSN